jgi:hypothetical protein
MTGAPPQRNLDDKIQYLLRAEESLFQSISARAPLAEILNGVCSALDRQIGNVVSLVSLPSDDVSELAAIAMNAAHFGLHTFSCEMYCTVSRSPSAGEFQLIERAKCLAAIAIKRHNDSIDQGNCGVRGSRPAWGRVLEWPVRMN